MATYTTAAGKRATYKEASSTNNTYVINDDTKGATIAGAVNGDIIAIEGFATDFTASVSGRVITLKSTVDTGIVIKVQLANVTGATASFRFLDGDLTATKGAKITLGTQTLTSKAAAIAETNTLGSNDSSATFDESSGGSSSTGSTFTLTTGADVGSAFTGGSGDDTFSGSAGTIDGDNLTGGNGTDTLNLTVTVADDDDAAFTSAGIETISIRSTGGTAGDAADIDLELGDVAGATTVEFRRINDDITLNNLQSLSTTLKLSNVSTVADVVVNYDAATVTGDADTASVTVDTSTGGGDVTVNGVETLAVTAVGADNDVNFDGDDLETITVAGSGDINFDIDASVTTVNAASNSGGVTVNTTAAADVAITGGSGNDTFNLGALLTADDTLNGGNGTDTLALSNAGAALAAIPADANISNIETLEITTTDDGAADAVTLVASRTKFNTVAIVSGDDADTFTLTGVTNEVITLTDVAAGDDAIDLINVSLTDATGAADSLTLSITNADLDAALIVDDINSAGGGIETLNLVLNQGRDVADAADIRVDDISSAHTTLNISGSADATLGTDVALTTATINAANATGDLTIELGAAAHSITGGSGDDTVDFNATLGTTDTLNGGAGDDWIVAALAAGTAAATVTNVENASLEFGTAGATFSGVNVSTALDTIEIADASDEAISLVNLKSAVTTIGLGSTATAAADNVSIGYAAGSNSAVTVTIGDDAEDADVDVGNITLTGNAGALSVVSDFFAGNSIADLTANAVTSLTIVTENALTATGALNATAATSVQMSSAGGALEVTGAQDLRRATSIVIDAADENITLTGAMTATAATSLTVTATDDFLQTGNFVSDADVTSVNLTASGVGSSIRYDGILDVDHVRAINLTATNGGTVTVDDIEMLGVDNDGDTDIDTSLTISATGTDANDVGSTVTVSAINVAAASTLDAVTITSDADGTVNFTVGGANLTITSINASASAGTLVFDSSTSGAAIALTTGAGDNTITTELDQADEVTLASGAGDDTIIILDDTTAADEITNFEAGANGDIISIDVSAIGAGAQNFASASLDSTLVVSIGTDDNGALVDAENAVTAGTNILRITNTFADAAAMMAAIDLDAEANAGGLLDNDVILVLWTDGASSYLSSVTLNGADGAAADANGTLVELVGVTVTDLTAANFAFV